MAGVCCRESRLWGAVGGLVLCAAFVGIAFLWRYAQAPVPVWALCAIVAAVVVPLVARDVAAKFRSTNWLLWAHPDGLWVNLRSYQNYHLPEAATVLHLPYEEIACARRHVETWSTPGPVGHDPDTLWKEESLELRLAPGDTREIAQALANERGLKAGIKGTGQPVTVPSPGVVRIGWRGHGNGVVPGLGRVLDELSPYVKLADPTRTDRPRWDRLSEAELDELLAQLIRSGDRIAAGALLIRRRGCSANEAHKLMEELSARA